MPPGFPFIISASMIAAKAFNAQSAIFFRSTKLNRILSSLATDALLAHEWKDEPNVGGRQKIVPPPVVAAWTYATRELDKQHPVVSNCNADDYYAYSASTQFNRRHSFFVDIQMFDAYPLEYREHPNFFNHPDHGVIDLWTQSLDRMTENTANLIPVGGFVEVNFHCSGFRQRTCGSAGYLWADHQICFKAPGD
jgi:hypothetical protein